MVRMKHPTMTAGTMVIDHDKQQIPVVNGVAEVPFELGEILRKSGWRECPAPAPEEEVPNEADVSGE